MDTDGRTGTVTDRHTGNTTGLGQTDRSRKGTEEQGCKDSNKDVGDTDKNRGTELGRGTRIETWTETEGPGQRDSNRGMETGTGTGKE